MSDFPKMDPTLRANWLTALRSGEYEKGREALRVNNSGDEDTDYSYCCLGVLREVCPTIQADKEGAFLAVESSGLPKEVQWILASLNDAKLTGPAKYSCGPQHGQQTGLSVTEPGDFTDTANWIEANL